RHAARAARGVFRLREPDAALRSAVRRAEEKVERLMAYFVAHAAPGVAHRDDEILASRLGTKLRAAGVARRDRERARVPDRVERIRDQIAQCLLEEARVDPYLRVRRVESGDDAHVARSRARCVLDQTLDERLRIDLRDDLTPVRGGRETIGQHASARDDLE